MFLRFISSWILGLDWYLCALFFEFMWSRLVNVDLQLIKDSQIFWVVIKLGILSSLASAFQICRSTFDKSTPWKHEREKIYTCVKIWTTRSSQLQDQVNHIYMCINLNLALYYIYVYSNNVVQKLPCHMAIIQNSGSKRTSVCTHMNKKINLCTCPLYIISSYPLFCCHCQSLRRSWAFFCDCSLVIPIAEEEG